jgi:hypothetical protein
MDIIKLDNPPTGKNKFRILFEMRWAILEESVTKELQQKGNLPVKLTEEHGTNLKSASDLHVYVSGLKSRQGWTMFDTPFIPKEHCSRLAKLSGLDLALFSIESDGEFRDAIALANKNSAGTRSWSELAQLSLRETGNLLAAQKESRDVQVKADGSAVVAPRRTEPPAFMIKVRESERPATARPIFTENEYIKLDISPKLNGNKTKSLGWRCLLVHANWGGALTWLNPISKDEAGNLVAAPIVLSSFARQVFPGDNAPAIQVDDSPGIYTIYGVFYSQDVDEILQPLLMKLASDGARNGNPINDIFHHAARDLILLHARNSLEVHRADYEVR